MAKSHQVIVWMFALVLPALFTAGSAHAAAAAAPPSVTVRFSDLNLNSTAGIAGLYKRIQDAATEVCRPVEGPQSGEPDALDRLESMLLPCDCHCRANSAQR